MNKIPPKWYDAFCCCFSFGLCALNRFMIVVQFVYIHKFYIYIYVLHMYNSIVLEHSSSMQTEASTTAATVVVAVAAVAPTNATLLYYVYAIGI